MSDEKPRCQLCGEPMPPGEEMFNYHGYSGPCPKPPIQPGGEMLDAEDACQSVSVANPADMICTRCGYSAWSVSAETHKPLLCQVCDARDERNDFKTERDEARVQLVVLRRAAAAWEAVVKHQITVGWELTEWAAAVAQPPLVGVGPTPIEAVEALVKKLEGK